jgi:hypothetical protein
MFIRPCLIIALTATTAYAKDLHTVVPGFDPLPSDGGSLHLRCQLKVKGFGDNEGIVIATDDVTGAVLYQKGPPIPKDEDVCVNAPGGHPMRIDAWGIG